MPHRLGVTGNMWRPYESYVKNDHLKQGRYVNDGFTPVCELDIADQNTTHAVVLVKIRNHHLICKNSYIEEKLLQKHIADKNPKKGYFIKFDIKTELKEQKLSKLKSAYRNDEI